MTFQKLGGHFQLLIRNASDLLYLSELDDAHWISTSACLSSFNCSLSFLDFLDSNSDGRIRSDEVRDALQWIFKVLNDISVLEERSDCLALSNINTDTEEGRKLLNAAQRILKNLNAPDQNMIFLNQATCRHDVLAAGECNGDGIIPLGSIKDIELCKFAEDVMNTIGVKIDIGGKNGVSSELIDIFFQEASSFVNWFRKAYNKSGDKQTSIMVRGLDTPQVFKVFDSLKEKIDQFFLYCQILKIDNSIMPFLKYSDDKITKLDVHNVTDLQDILASAPLAPPNSDSVLYFDENINPFYNSLIKKFLKHVLSNTNAESLTYDQWQNLKNEFSQYALWDKGKPQTKVENLGVKQLEIYLNGNFRENIKPLFNQDLAVAVEIKQINLVEKILLYKKFIMDFVNDFVSLSHLFDPEKKSMIQFGRLVLDGRHFDLNVKIENIAEHKKIAQKSNICIMYLDLCITQNGKQKHELIASAITSGTVHNIFIGKRGVFFSNDGLECDAVVLDFIKHPVSVTEALLMPFSKLSAYLKKRTEKMPDASYQTIEKTIGEGLSGAPKKKKLSTEKSSTSWTAPLMLLGGGIGLAGIGSAFESMAKAWQYISIWQIILFIMILLFICIVPIIIAAVIKLRSRNIGMFLEASGRAMNSPLRLTRKMGLIFTGKPNLPKKSRKIIFDRIPMFFKNSGFQHNSKLLHFLLLVFVAISAYIIGYYLFLLLICG
jgi:hypothetical protein